MFGVDNFKRDRKEIEDIMKIIIDVVGSWVAPGGLAHRLEVCLKHCGERGMLEPRLLEVLDRAMDSTKHYGRCAVTIPLTRGIMISQISRVKVNLCIAYSGRREIVRGVSLTVHNESVPFTYSYACGDTRVEDEEKRISKNAKMLLQCNTSQQNKDIIFPATEDAQLEATRRTLTESLWTKDDPPVDIVIRTSGETRLSDYMLWQCCENAQLNFIDCFWPEVRIWHLARIVLGWRMGRTF